MSSRSRPRSNWLRGLVGIDGLRSDRSKKYSHPPGADIRSKLPSWAMAVPPSHIACSGRVPARYESSIVRVLRSVDDVETLVEDCRVVTEVLESDDVGLEVDTGAEDGVEDDVLCELEVCRGLVELEELVELELEEIVDTVLCEVA